MIVTAANIKLARDLYFKGMPLKRVGEALGCTYTTCWRMREAGFDLKAYRDSCNKQFSKGFSLRINTKQIMLIGIIVVALAYILVTA